MGLKEDLDRITLQERELTFPSMDADLVWKIGSKLRDIAIQRCSPVVIDIRRFGHPLFYAAMEGTTPDNPEWVRRKSNVVARFHHSSYTAALNEKLKGKTIYESQGLPLADYATHGGSFPIRVTNAGIIGSITVSGLPMRQDHELVVEALCAILGQNYDDLKLPPE
jgi:uncharacterized protein (UPF0303 family)